MEVTFSVQCINESVVPSCQSCKYYRECPEVPVIFSDENQYYCLEDDYFCEIFDKISEWIEKNCNLGEFSIEMIEPLNFEISEDLRPKAIKI